ncbi:MAG: hypothetical protein ACLGH4_02615 [Actinomycetes bacterium]
MQHYAAKMLRLTGRRDMGMALTAEETKRLESWLETLRQQHAVVGYAPHTDDGFQYVDGDFTERGLPILAATIEPRSRLTEESQRER